MKRSLLCIVRNRNVTVSSLCNCLDSVGDDFQRFVLKFLVSQVPFPFFGSAGFLQILLLSIFPFSPGFAHSWVPCSRWSVGGSPFSVCLCWASHLVPPVGLPWWWPHFQHTCSSLKSGSGDSEAGLMSSDLPDTGVSLSVHLIVWCYYGPSSFPISSWV